MSGQIGMEQFSFFGYDPLHVARLVTGTSWLTQARTGFRTWQFCKEYPEVCVDQEASF